MSKESIDILIENLSMVDYIKVTKEISDLQQENQQLKEELKEEKRINVEDLKEIDRQQERIDKTIEYIDNCLPCIHDEEILEDIKKILKGEV